MEDPSIDECFRLLRLRRGAAFSAVKQAYRTNLYKCHPDRFQGQPDLLPVAERKTKRLIQIYGILEQWYLQNAGVDPVSAFAGAGTPQTGGPSSEEPPFEGEDPPDVHRLRFGITIAVGVAVLAVAAWLLISGPLSKEAPATGEAGESVPAKPAQLRPQPLVPAQPSPQDMTKAGLEAMIAERDRVKSAWSADYMRDSEKRRQDADRELADAQVQFGRDVASRAPEIKEAQDEIDRQVERSRRESAVARDLFTKQEQAYLDSIKVDYDSWLLAQGRDAITKIERLRKRENSEIGLASIKWTPIQAALMSFSFCLFSKATGEI